jgi:hypothetical protein
MGFITDIVGSVGRVATGQLDALMGGIGAPAPSRPAPVGPQGGDLVLAREERPGVHLTLDLGPPLPFEGRLTLFLPLDGNDCVTPAPSGYASSTSPSLTFLDDPSMSIEDKLFLFMRTVQERFDRDLTDKMKSYRARFGEGGSAAADEKVGAGLLDKLGITAGVGDLLEQLGGPLAMAAATALGFPIFAPLAGQVGAAFGGTLGQMLETSAGGARSGEGAGGTGSADERLLFMELERLQQKQSQMYAAISNMLKGTHDAAMVAINNIR